ncbi:hypothetical protein [Sansalvadorimonas verongulae]|uniref:hypothetical protein n=1 Tax=Sansalvadorimonas verongulae TaxID=2172824 RepID=UPI0012BCF24D|nr:hypothetical protein [Sansalvadorimonas verongulae]MTI14103.1 hypothetical protein [Sansalvadorimonas verongulae]
MPVSCEMNRKKVKSKSELLCDKIDGIIKQAQKQITAFTKTKNELEFESGLLKKAMSMKLGSEEDIRQVAADMKTWKTEVKSDVKSAVNAKKQELRFERKERRKMLKLPETEKKTTAKRTRKKRGGFI